MSDDRELYMRPFPVGPMSTYWRSVQKMREALTEAMRLVADAQRGFNRSGPSPSDPTAPMVPYFDFDAFTQDLANAHKRLPSQPKSFVTLDGGCSMPAPTELVKLT